MAAPCGDVTGPINEINRILAFATLILIVYLPLTIAFPEFDCKGDSHTGLFDLAFFNKTYSDVQVVRIRSNRPMIDSLSKWEGTRQILGNDTVDDPLTNRLLVKYSFHVLFRRSPAMLAALKNMRHELGIREGEPYIGMHIRIGVDKSVCLGMDLTE